MSKPITKGNLVLGIDTGGTYTDGVLLNYDTHEVIASHKSLTTKRDYAIGIEHVIDKIHIEDPAAIKMVSVSTTLATNAIAENKGKRVALFLIGYDPDLIKSFKMEARFATPNYYYFKGGHTLHGQEREPLDINSILEKVHQVKNQVDAIAVSSYFSPLNPEHELSALKAINSVCDLPVVLGHQLSTKLGSVERATTAALNASLLSVLQAFIIAVKQTMKKHEIYAPLMVVRGDGTLMSDEFAAKNPIETIHSGPAASAIGGRFLSGIEDALIVDVGGTTTDLALIIDGQVNISEQGAIVSDFKTSVKAANLLSIGLGGDSHLQISRENEILVGPERVVPLAYLAKQTPQITAQLHSLVKGSWKRTSPDWLEYWYLIRQPEDDHLIDNARKKKLVEILTTAPRPLPELLKRLDVFHPSQLGAQELLRQEIIGKSGFTPTDLLHVDGRYNEWNAAASRFALQIFSTYLHKEKEEVQTLVWQNINEKLLRAGVTFITNQDVAFKKPDENFGAWFFYNTIYQNNPHLKPTLNLTYPLIGIGGPASMFLEPIAKVLNTDLILPTHYQVANAVGAVAGSIMVEEEILLYPKLSKNGIEVVGYYVQFGAERFLIQTLENALELARDKGQKFVLESAIHSGADQPEVVVEERLEGIDTYRIRVQAIGKPRLSH